MMIFSSSMKKCSLDEWKARLNSIKEYAVLLIAVSKTNGFHSMECPELNEMSRYKGQASLDILYFIKGIITSNQLQ